MTISVIIPTYNGAHKVVNALRALAQQTLQDFEVLVVIDGSTDNTAEVLHRQDWGLKNLKIIEQPNGGRSISRNNGARQASGELLVFLDDDMRPPTTWIEKHTKRQHLQAIHVGGQIEDYAVLKTDFQRFKAYLSRKWAEPYLNASAPLSKENLFLTAANFSIPKIVSWQLGGFDERLTDAEDFDLGVRAFLQNIPIYFDKENIAWHDDFITCKSYVRRLGQYAASHDKLLALKPELYTQFNQYQPKPIHGLKKAIYYFFSAPFWVGSIDKWKIWKILPQKIRYKLYDIIITAQTRKK